MILAQPLQRSVPIQAQGGELGSISVQPQTRQRVRPLRSERTGTSGGPVS